jgi:hypothetical protein
LGATQRARLDTPASQRQHPTASSRGVFLFGLFTGFACFYVEKSIQIKTFDAVLKVQHQQNHFSCNNLPKFNPMDSFSLADYVLLNH